MYLQKGNGILELSAPNYFLKNDKRRREDFSEKQFYMYARNYIDALQLLFVSVRNNPGSKFS